MLCRQVEANAYHIRSSAQCVFCLQITNLCKIAVRVVWEPSYGASTLASNTIFYISKYNKVMEFL